MENLDLLRVIHPPGVGGFVEWRCIWWDKGGQRQGPRRFTRPGEPPPPELWAFNRRGFHVYFGVALRRERGKGGGADLASTFTAWAELDAKHFAGGKPAALAVLRSTDPRPSALVDSGNGYHAYWFLRSPLDLSMPEGVARIEAINSALHERINGRLPEGRADSVFDAPRILRLPGSLNVKRPDNPVRCNLVELVEGRRYAAEELPRVELAPKVANATASNGKRSGGKFVPTPGLPKVTLRGLPEFYIKRIRESVPVGKRSEAVFSVVAYLRGKVGWSDDALRALLEDARWGIGERYREDAARGRDFLSAVLASPKMPPQARRMPRHAARGGEARRTSVGGDGASLQPSKGAS